MTNGARTHTHTHAHAHKYVRTRTRTHTRTHTHTHACTHSQPLHLGAHYTIERHKQLLAAMMHTSRKETTCRQCTHTHTIQQQRHTCSTDTTTNKRHCNDCCNCTNTTTTTNATATIVATPPRTRRVQVHNAHCHVTTKGTAQQRGKPRRVPCRRSELQTTTSFSVST